MISTISTTLLSDSLKIIEVIEAFHEKLIIFSSVYILVILVSYFYLLSLLIIGWLLSYAGRDVVERRHANINYQSTTIVIKNRYFKILTIDSPFTQFPLLSTSLHSISPSFHCINLSFPQLVSVTDPHCHNLSCINLCHNLSSLS
jgi:hypothetical protein